MARQPHPCSKCGEPCWGTNCQTCGWAKEKPTLVCRRCGVEFVPASQWRKDRPAKFCSRACAGAGMSRPNMNRITANCEVCGGEFTRKASDFARRPSRFCSKKCHGAWRTSQRLDQPKPPRSRVWFPTCAICGDTFCARSATAKYCSAQCRTDVAGARVKDLYALAIQFDKQRGQYVGAEWRQRLLRYLVDRDGTGCAICGRKINMSLKSGPKGSRRGPSVDHIVPRSLGGTDDITNLRLACWGCNQKRGNRGGGEQLALVG